MLDRRPSYVALAIALASGAIACRSSSEAVPDAAVDGAAAAPKAPATVDAAAALADDDGAPCANDGDCASGLVCFYVNPGCEARSRNGACRAPSWGHECAVNRPMCGCDGRTLWGRVCAGVIQERWSSLERCPCTTDADCKGGQQCFFGEASCTKQGSCEDPAKVKCPATTASFCTCKNKTAAQTCAQAMREPWSKATACGP
jgi:hypothetical protein